MLSRDDAVVGATAPPAAPPSADELVKVVQQLWPEGLVEERRMGEPTVASMAYAFVPNRASARFLLPLPHRASASKTLRKYSAALSPREILQRAAMSVAFHLGGSAMLRDRVTVLGEHRSLRTFLSAWFQTPVSFSVSIGTARVNRKPVLQVFDRRGRTLAYAKVGSTASVAEDVATEARALRQVADVLPAQIKAPRVLGTETWEGSFVMLLSPLAVSMWQSHRGRRTPPVQHMLLLSEAFAEPDALLTETAVWTRLVDACTALPAGAFKESYTAWLSELARRSEARAVRVGAWHGDWTSWNMARSRRRVLLWDWERFETGVPTGMDHCHFVVNVATRDRGFSATTILEALDGLRPVGQHVTAADLVVGTYLARVALRYGSSAVGPSGQLIAQRAAIVAQALDTWLTRNRP